MNRPVIVRPVKHRAAARNVTVDNTYVPRHCAGPDQGRCCLHNHPGEPIPWRDFVSSTPERRTAVPA